MAIISVIAVASVPSLITYWRAATTKAAAEELAAGLNSARQLAIAKAQSVCFEVSGGKYRFLTGGCGGTVWTGLGTGANGYMTLTNKVTLTANANPVFDYLGAASGATLTVTNQQGDTALKVVVSVSGRVRVCPAAGCPS
jgi:Tfp pilus assembly protein FimT